MNTQTHKGNGHVTLKKAEIRMTHLQAKECQGVAQDFWELPEAKTSQGRVPIQASEGAWPLPTP